MTTLLAFLVVIFVLVIVHEYGHYLAARLSGVKVLKFSIGFGKPLFVRRMGRDGTEWAISALPLGGYVKMLDEREGPVAPAERHRAFNRQGVYRRFAIVALPGRHVIVVQRGYFACAHECSPSSAEKCSTGRRARFSFGTQRASPYPGRSERRSSLTVGLSMCGPTKQGCVPT